VSNITVKNQESISVTITQSGYNKSTVIKQPVENQIDIRGLKGGGDKNYVHVQNTPSATWTASHNLGKKPAVVVVDSADEVVYGEINYTDDNTVTLTFVGAFSGRAYFN
jgi:hypothetical protein